MKGKRRGAKRRGPPTLTGHPEDRRRIRYRATLPLRVRSASGEIQGETRNVSLLGVSAIMSRPLAPSTEVTAEIDLPGGGVPIRMEGAIVRSTPLNLPGETRYEVGVFAVKFHDQDDARLSQYLDQLQMAEYAVIRAGYKAMQLKIRQRKARKRALLLAKRRRLAKRLARRRHRAKTEALRKAKAAARRRRTRAAARRAGQAAATPVIAAPSRDDGAIVHPPSEV